MNVIEFTEADTVRHRLTSYFIGIFKETPEVEVKLRPKNIAVSKPVIKKFSFKDFFSNLFRKNK